MPAPRPSLPRYYPPLPEKIPVTLLFRGEIVEGNSEYVEHSHPWSQIICVKSGVLAMRVAGQRYLAPREFAIWIPAGVEHSSYNRKTTRFCVIDIAPELDIHLPVEPCLLTPTAIFNAIADDCFSRNMTEPQSETDLRMCRVLLDQISLAPRQNTYLPTSENKLLSPVLSALEKNPADNTSLAQWAKQVYTTERTLSRRCQQELGMSFAQWRQRLRFLHAVSLLEQGKTVQEVSLELGYSSSSAFIAMFQQVSGTTPQRFRNDR
ncbi:helix-turn-helix transcriptional regulator [Rahnella sp. C60]|uniref:AraC family transcriptional regulator n=1 Tax=Rahnella perminowiae TaxID=2816244 RepID=UPI001C277CBF|nr:helix-turn-helix transcriptional regulator [Rahnella perminowiae]MBU9813037.1 helix-turn-helix transcriptional regulator [Rahnella perminowiae]MBU9815723.1 helix-turn-helix transcriptional regulator [Rahnella perminowiae]